MKSLVRIVGAIAATAFAIAPLVTPLNANAGAIIVIIAAGAAAFGPALIDKNRARKARKRATSRSSNRSRLGMLLLFAILPLALLSSACDDAPKRAAQGTLVAATAIDEGIVIKREFRANGDLERPAELPITRAMRGTNSGLQQVTDTARCFELYTADVRANLIRGAGDVVTILDNLNRDDVLHIKSAEGQRLRDNETKLSEDLTYLES